MNAKASLISVSVLSLLGPIISVQAFAEVYMSESQAAAAIFPAPGLKFASHDLELVPDEIKKIEAASDQKVRNTKLRYFLSSSKEIVFIDQVLGKHEFITYAVGLKPDGKVAGIEIIEYRESYGQQVRKPEWRAQFVDKNLQAKFKLDDDIKNLSGATLSSAHITAGVKRIVHTYDVIHERLK